MVWDGRLTRRHESDLMSSFRRLRGRENGVIIEIYKILIRPLFTELLCAEGKSARELNRQWNEPKTTLLGVQMTKKCSSEAGVNI